MTSSLPVTRTTLQTMTLVFVDDVDEAARRALGTAGRSLIRRPTSRGDSVRQSSAIPGATSGSPAGIFAMYHRKAGERNQFGTLPGADHS